MSKGDPEQAIFLTLLSRLYANGQQVFDIEQFARGIKRITTVYQVVKKLER